MSYVGLYSGDAEVQLESPPTADLTATFSSAVPFGFTALNGAKLAFAYGTSTPGVVTLIPVGDDKFVAFWDAIFTPVPAASTGQYKRVTGGSFRMFALTEPFSLGEANVGYIWWGQGTIEVTPRR